MTRRSKRKPTFGPLPKFKPPSPEERQAARTVMYGHIVRDFAKGTELAANYDFSPEYKAKYAAAALLLAEILNKRLALLFEHYSLPREHGATLAYYLACDLIPGFDPLYVPNRGHPKNVLREHKPLAEAVRECMRIDGSLTIKAACATLSRKAGPYKGKRPSALEARFHRYVAAESEFYREF